MRKAKKDHAAFILIFVLWALAFLAVLAVAVGLGAGQKIALLKHLENRSQSRLAAEAGAKKAVSVLMDDVENSLFGFSAASKQRRHNNPSEFTGKLSEEISFEVSCRAYDDVAQALTSRAGLCDEQGKINLNTTDAATLKRLIEDVLALSSNDARALAVSIIDWRDYGEHEAAGFFSDDYYSNLDFPYDLKDQKYERIDELLLVKGMDGGIYNGLLPYLTIYGDGKININTVSGKVLVAFGLDAALAEKILKVRRGPDGIEATGDDHIFARTFDVAIEVNAVEPLLEKEARAIDALNLLQVLSTASSVYSARSFSYDVRESAPGASVMFVYNAAGQKMMYWHEK
jgi:type II secretory pathway component PulK